MVTVGDYVHFYEYKKPVIYGFSIRKRPPRIKTKSDDSCSENNLYRIRKQVRFILQANISINTPLTRLQFVTYTFKKEITEFKDANYILNKYHKRLNYELHKTGELSQNENLKYFLVPEIQHKRALKYGAKVWHYHIIYFNLPGLWYPRITKIWGQGGIKVKPMNDLDHLVNYVSKYFTKSKSDDYAKGQHKYFTSRALERPLEFREEDVITELKNNLDAVSKPTYVNSYKSKSWNEQENETKYSLYKLTSEQKINFNSLKPYMTKF